MTRQYDRSFTTSSVSHLTRRRECSCYTVTFCITAISVLMVQNLCWQSLSICAPLSSSSFTTCPFLATWAFPACRNVHHDFFWHALYHSDIRNVSSCDMCQHRKTPTSLRAEKQQPLYITVKTFSLLRLTCLAILPSRRRETSGLLSRRITPQATQSCMHW